MIHYVSPTVIVMSRPEAYISQDLRILRVCICMMTRYDSFTCHVCQSDVSCDMPRHMSSDVPCQRVKPHMNASYHI